MDLERVGISTAAFYPAHLTEDALDAIARLDFRVVEIFLQADAEYTGHFGAILERRRRALGLEVYSIHLYATLFDLWSFYPRMVRETRDRFYRVLDVASEVGAQALTWHGLRYGLEDPRLIRAFFESAAWAGQRAQEAGVSLCLENVSWCYLRAPQHVRAIQRANLPLAFTFDSFQALESQVPPADLVQAMAGQLKTVHLSDYRASGPRHLPPGQGEIAWPLLMKAIQDAGYEGPLILETARVRDPDVLLAARAFVRDAWEAGRRGRY